LHSQVINKQDTITCIYSSCMDRELEQVKRAGRYVAREREENFSSLPSPLLWLSALALATFSTLNFSLPHNPICWLNILGKKIPSPSSPQKLPALHAELTFTSCTCALSVLLFQCLFVHFSAAWFKAGHYI